jgi:hypothetical protein
MAIIFVVSKERVDEFWASMIKTKENCGSGFFIYLDLEQPKYTGGMGVI